MNRQQLFESLWIPVTDRLPPDKMSYWVLGWNPKCKIILRYPARGIRDGVKKRLNNIPPDNEFEAENYSAYWVTAWMRGFPPKGEKDIEQLFQEKIK